MYFFREKRSKKVDLVLSDLKTPVSITFSLLIKNENSLHLCGDTSSAPQNNPGWYLPEDDGTGGVAIQRRNMPLLKDNTSLFVLSQKTKVNESVHHSFCQDF